MTDTTKDHFIIPAAPKPTDPVTEPTYDRQFLPTGRRELSTATITNPTAKR
jgi:hypothetical protein